MALVSRSSYLGTEERAKGEKKMELKDTYWKDEDGKVAKGDGDKLPKGWAKGKLVAKKGDEISDLEAKELGIKKETKAKAPAENKDK